MSPKRPIPPQSSRTIGRRSGGVTQFLSLDLYSKGKIEKALTSFKSNENHNGIKGKVGSGASIPSTPMTKAGGSVKKRGRSVSVNTSNKKPKHVSSPTSPAVSQSDEAVAPEKKRGRPPGSGAKNRAKSPAQPKKGTVKKVLNHNLLSSDDEEEEDGRKVARPASAKPKSAPRTAANAQPRVSSSHKTLFSVLEDTIAEKNPNMSGGKKKKMASATLLNEMCEQAITKIGAHDDIFKHNLSTAVHLASSGIRLPEATALDKADKQAAELKLLRQKSKDLEKEKKNLCSALAKKDSELVQADDETKQLQSEILQMKQQLDMVAIAPNSGASSSSSNSTNRSRSATAVASSAAVHSQIMMLPQLQQPQNFASMPRGSAVGHTTMAGRAGEIIDGLANIDGIGDTMASVAVTAATMPEIDGDGNAVQRTIRTRVERIAVTDGMNIEALAALGFQVVSNGDSDLEDDDDDDEEEDDIDDLPVRVEEVEEDDEVIMGHGEDEDGEGEPYIEEAE